MSVYIFASYVRSSVGISVYICLSVRLYVGQSSVCHLLCLLGRVPIYFSLCVVHCANPILLIPIVSYS